MKHAKKLVSILLVLAMALTLSIAAFAAGDGSIKIENAIEGTEYKAYKIFDLVYSGTAYTYTIATNSAWISAINGFIAANTDCGLSLADYETGKKLVQTTDAFDEAAAAELAAYLKANTPTGVTADATLNTTNGYTANVPYGYYFVDSNLGSLCELRNSDPEAVITEKNEEPTIEKQVQEDSKVGTADEWDTRNDADLGQTVNYKTTITVAAGNEGYVLHDTMTGLTLNADTVEVTVNGAVVESAGNYNLTTGCADNCAFEIKFEDSYIATLAAGTEIIVTYSAVVNDEAKIAAANPNETWLKYGEESAFESTHKKTETFVWEFGVNKITADTKTPLKGAKFTLSKSEDGSNPLTFTKADTVYTYDATGAENAFETTETGKFMVNGLDADTYYLTEIEAPAGYNKLTAPIKVVIDNEGNVSFNDAAEDDKIVDVENNTGTQLPETGGIGTTIFYIIGGLLAVGAVVLLVSKKRMSLAEAAE